MQQGSAFALLLDFDGTMADTVSPLASIYAEFIEQLGAGDAAPSFAQANGADLSELILGLARKHAPHQDAEKLWQAYWVRVSTVVTDAAPCPGLVPLMQWARGRSWKIGIASSSRTALISDWLRRQKLDGYIDDVVGADRVERSKPHPDIYLALMRYLGVVPANCIAIEDSRSGVRAARAAALDVIWIGTELEADDILPCHIAIDLGAATDYLRRRHGDIGA